MPVPSLPPFFTFRPDNFHIGGSVSTLMAAAVRWRTFGDSALEAASAMRSINDGGFEGTEGDRFRELVNSDFPSNLQVTGDAHVGVADAISRYATLLSERKAEMATLETTARGSHAAVNAAAANVNAAEAALAAAPDPASKSAAAAALAAATAEHQAALGVWEGNLATAQGIRTMLGTDAEAQAAIIDTQSRKAFKDNPKPWEAAWNAVSDWLNEHGDILSFIADALQIVGAIAMFICPVVGAVLLGIGVGLKGLLAAAGVVSWGEFAFDLATAGPLGVLGKAVKAGKLGATAAKGLNKASSVSTKALSSVKSAASSAAMRAALETAGGINRLGSEKLAKDFFRTATRGREVCFNLEPVDMATGNMVDFETDVFIDGILPLVLDRNANTNHELGRALGPRWVSTMDIRLEICADEVLMLTPDGALLTFPPAPTDGSEVRADGRPWLLSYADGAYRVRNIAAGLTYTFRLFDLDGDSEDTASPGVKDESPSLGGSYVAAIIPSGSLAETVDAGMEVGLSSVVHHTGASIEYTWDVATGHMVRMQRSDDTVIDLEWDKAVGRVAHVYVSNPSTHPDEDPLRLISYAYDAYGQLVRVINSNDGALEYHYDEHGRMNAWTDRNGVSYYYRFDKLGRVHSQVGTGGMFPNIVYWADDEGDDAPEGGRVCVAIETAGEFQGDPLELGDSVVDEYFSRLEELPLYKALVEGGLTAAGMTGCGRTSSRDDETWTVPGEWLHDEFLGDIRPTVYRSTPAGDVWRVITPEGQCIDSTFNQYHQKTSVTSPTGETTELFYNESGIEIGARYMDGTEYHVEAAAWGTPGRLVGRDGKVTEFEVDLFGLIRRMTTPSGATTTFDHELRPSGITPSRVQQPDGTVTLIECDNAGRVVAATDTAGRRVSYCRNVSGLVAEVIDPVGGITSTTFTPEGWPAVTEFADGAIKTATYDAEGNVLSTVDEIGSTTSAVYTVFDRVARVTDAAGASTQVEYNTQMEPVRLTNADGRVWSFFHNLDGMVTCEVDFNGIRTEDEILDNGQTVIHRTPMGSVTRHYRPDGLLRAEVDELGTSEFQYDELGRVLSVSGPQASVSYERDDYGRVVEESIRLATGEVTRHRVDFSRAGSINAEHFDLALGETFTNKFIRDKFGEIEASVHSHSTTGSTGANVIQELKYVVGPSGERQQIDAGILSRKLETDVRGRRISDRTYATGVASAGASEISTREYSWRADSILIGILDKIRGTTQFDVDPVGRVTGVNRSSRHALDRHGRFQAGKQEPFAATEHYEFSNAGMLTGSDVSRGSLSICQDRDEDKRVSDSKFDFEGTLPTRVGRTAYKYDRAGRITQTVTRRVSKKPLVKNFIYGSGTQPIGVTISDEVGIGYRYLYDPLGRRVAKERVNVATGGVLERTVFTYAGNRLVGEEVSYLTEERTATGIGRVWVSDPSTGGLVGQIRLSVGRRAKSRISHNETTAIKTSFAFVTTDLAGSPQELVDPQSGKILGYSSQSLYGTREWFGDESCPLLFSGQYLDAESGWAYNRFRYYSPEAGIYNAQDPLGLFPNLSSAQGYVEHAAHITDPLGLKKHIVSLPEDQQWRVFAHNHGVIGEQAAADFAKEKGMSIGPRDSYTIEKRRRISDGVIIQDGIENGVAEVKNVKSISMTEQLRDAVAFTQEKYPEGKLHLFVRQDTDVASTVTSNESIQVWRMGPEYFSTAKETIINSETQSFWMLAKG